MEGTTVVSDFLVTYVSCEHGILSYGANRLVLSFGGVTWQSSGVNFHVEKHGNQGDILGSNWSFWVILTQGFRQASIQMDHFPMGTMAEVPFVYCMLRNISRQLVL